MNYLEINKNNLQTKESLTFDDYIKHSIKRFEKGEILTDKGLVYSKSTLRGYNSFFNRWQEFQKEENKTYLISEIVPNLVNNFSTYLADREFTKNSIGLILSKFKALLRMAFMEGLHYWNGSGIKTPKELTTQVYLTLEEVKAMNKLNLRKTERAVLDMFLVQTFTGMRFESVKRFLESPMTYIKDFGGESYIEITASKTGQQSVVPLSKIVIDIIKRNKGNVKTFTEVYINREIKKIAEKAGINQPIAKVGTRGGKRTEVFTPKSDMISTHTARRTFITLGKQLGIPDRALMGITGHRTETQLNNYNRTTNFEKIKGVINHDFFKLTI